MPFQGKGKTIHKPFVAVNQDPNFYFGGEKIPVGVEVKHWETRNFGWVSYKEVKGNITHVRLIQE